MTDPVESSDEENGARDASSKVSCSDSAHTRFSLRCDDPASFNHDENPANIAAATRSLTLEQNAFQLEPSSTRLRMQLQASRSPRWADMEDDDDGCVENAKGFRAKQSEVEPMMSAGSVGHPLMCKRACKYLKKPKGCKDGAHCDRCHLCDWKAPSRATHPKGAGRYSHRKAPNR